jgi:hypothetical protein
VISEKLVKRKILILQILKSDQILTVNCLAMFDLEGVSLGSYPGWYNWPVDMVIGGQNQVQCATCAMHPIQYGGQKG